MHRHMADEEHRQLNRGTAAKARAKELRKATEKRAEKKEQRHKEKREQQASSSAGAATPRAYDSPKGTTASKAGSSCDVCKFFLAGTCNKGDKCRFQHVIVDAAAPAAEEDASGGAAAATLQGYDALNREMWQEVLLRLDDGPSMLAAASACRELAEAAAEDAVWAPLHARLFRDPSLMRLADGEEEDEAPYSMANGYTARERVCQSEGQLQLWRRAGGAARPPVALALPGMTAVAMAPGGGLGVSAHAGRLVRLWDARTGRRLAAAEHRRELSACAAARAVVAAGDAAGHVNLYPTDAEFAAVRANPRTWPQPQPEPTPDQPVSLGAELGAARCGRRRRGGRRGERGGAADLGGGPPPGGVELLGRGLAHPGRPHARHGGGGAQRAGRALQPQGRPRDAGAARRRQLHGHPPRRRPARRRLRLRRVRRRDRRPVRHLPQCGARGGGGAVGGRRRAVAAHRRAVGGRRRGVASVVGSHARRQRVGWLGAPGPRPGRTRARRHRCRRAHGGGRAGGGAAAAAAAAAAAGGRGRRRRRGGGGGGRRSERGDGGARPRRGGAAAALGPEQPPEPEAADQLRSGVGPARGGRGEPPGGARAPAPAPAVRLSAGLRPGEGG